MNSKIVVALLSGTLVDSFHVAQVKTKAFAYAQSLVNGKGIINLGAGPHRPSSEYFANAREVVVNIDAVRDGLPNFIQLDIEREYLPFGDKQFDCSFMSHVLEHLSDWQFALDEACRVSDSVIVVLPHPFSPSGLLHPSHKQHFGFQAMKDIETSFPDVKVFC